VAETRPRGTNKTRPELDKILGRQTSKLAISRSAKIRLELPNRRDNNSHIELI
jgi:hypothetical protein